MADRILDPKAAADEIRTQVLDVPDMSPEERHMSVFAGQVCEELGLDADDPFDLIRVVRALHEADIQPHLAQEYPKMLTDGDSKPVLNAAGQPVVFQTEEDEDHYNEHGHLPDEAPPAPRADTDHALGPQHGPRDPTHDNKPDPLRGVQNPDARNDADRQSDSSDPAKNAMVDRPNDLQPDVAAELGPNRSRSKQKD